MISASKSLPQSIACFVVLFIFMINRAIFSTASEVSGINFELLKVIPGNDNIIISVPHGGYLLPRVFPDRENGCMENDSCSFRIGCYPKSDKCKIIPRRDMNALEIGRRLVKTLQDKGRKPYAVFMLLHRQKIDPNRPKSEACQGNENCLKVYNIFHDFIKSSRKSVRGPGLYLDVHTIRHQANWTELGYRISKGDLNRVSIDGLSSSIDQLRRRTELSLDELIRGNRSLGHLLSNFGYKIIPSPKYPHPGKKGYARGGFNTLEYGSLKGGCIDGIQVEGSLKLRLATKQVVEEFADRLAEAVLKFMKEFGYDDPNTVCAGAHSIVSMNVNVFGIILSSFVSAIYLMH